MVGMVGTVPGLQFLSSTGVLPAGIALMVETSESAAKG